MNKILSIIVPSYNAEIFLPKGIPTFLDKEILGDIEILIIDDGSSDDTARIADNYHAMYPDTIIAVHKKNGGHGSAINKGIELAQGKYFCVVDADDWVDTSSFVTLIQKMKACDVDLFLAHAAVVDSDGKAFDYKRIKSLPEGIEVELKQYIGKVPNIDMHNYYIRTDLLRKNKIQCHEHSFYVDQEYVLYSLFYVKTVIYLDLIVYQYLIGRRGQSFSMESRKKYLDQYINILEALIFFYDSKKDEMNEGQRVHYKRKIAHLFTGVYGVLLAYNTKDRRDQLKKIDQDMKCRYPYIYDANRNFCVTLLRVTSFRIYYLCAFVYKIVNRLY